MLGVELCVCNNFLDVFGDLEVVVVQLGFLVVQLLHLRCSVGHVLINERTQLAIDYLKSGDAVHLLTCCILLGCNLLFVDTLDVLDMSTLQVHLFFDRIQLVIYVNHVFFDLGRPFTQ